MSAGPVLFAGYKPIRVKAVEQAALMSSKPADVMRIGPTVRVGDVRTLQAFLRVAPSDQTSEGRTAVVDLSTASREVQSALLRVVEEPPPGAQFVLFAAELSCVLPTVVSRCQVHVFAPPSYGQIVADLSSSGIGMSVAAHAARHVTSGRDVDDVPSETAFARARAFLEAAHAGNVRLTLRATRPPARRDEVPEFDARALEALRTLLAPGGSGVSALEATYGAPDPWGAALLVYREVQRRRASQ